MLIQNGAFVLQPGEEYVEHLSKLIPSSRKGVVGGKPTIAVKHGLEEVLVARNIGFDVPSPINYGWQYPGMYPPRDNQVHTAAFATLYRRAFILSEMRVGKTAASIWAAEFLIQNGFVRRVLVVCPKSCMKLVWQTALFECVPHRSAVIAHGSKDQRIKQINKGTEFVIINHDGITALAEYKEEKRRQVWTHPHLSDKGFDLIIYDEADVLGNHRTDLHQAFAALLTPTTWLWLMTGTPTPPKYWDAWGLLKLVCSKMPASSWTQFRERLGSKLSQYKWVNKFGAKEVLHSYMQPAIRFTQKQCFDLPPCPTIPRSAELTKEQKSLYWQMQRAGAIERGEGESRVIAANAAVKVAKMLQISAGAVKDEFGNKVAVTPTGRLGVLLELLHELSVLPAKHPEIEWSKKTIVFIPFIYVMEDVKAWLESKGYRVGLVNGGVPQWKRDEVWGGFKRVGQGSQYEIVVAHPEVVQYGLDLTEAESVIWYAPCTGVKMYSQACQRIQGEKQKGSPCIIQIICTRLEQDRFDALQKGGMTQEEFLAMYDRAIVEDVGGVE